MTSHRHRPSDLPAVDEMLGQLKPKLRGWLHVGMAPLALLAGIVLIVIVPTRSGRVSAAVFTLTAVLLFSTSAVYHRGSGRWPPKVEGLLRRLDHSNIFLVIAGSYTPFALLLPPRQRWTMLLIVWIGALGGVIFRVAWVNAPRWLYVPIYIALGWVAVFYLRPLWQYAGPAALVLVAIGGVLYTAGAVVYALKRPNPSPRWFGFHEVFHAFTIAAFATHYAAAALALSRAS